MLSDHTMREIYKDYNVLDTKQKEIIKNIAEKFPFNIETVTYAYINCKFSEENTIEELECVLSSPFLKLKEY